MGIRRVLSRRTRRSKKFYPSTDTESNKLLCAQPEPTPERDDWGEVDVNGNSGELGQKRRSPRLIQSLLQFLRFKDRVSSRKQQSSWSDAATQNSISPLRLSEDLDRHIPDHRPLLRRTSSLSFQTPKKLLKPTQSLFFKASPSTKKENQKIRKVDSVPSLRRQHTLDFDTVVRRETLKPDIPMPIFTAPYTAFLPTVQELDEEDLSRIKSIESLSLPALTEVASLKTAELSAAAQVYLNAHFMRLTCSPSPRSMRAKTVEQLVEETVDVYKRNRLRDDWLKSETERLRLSRAKKPTVDDYEVVKVIGKGAFGIVKLVRSKDEWEGEDSGRKQLYAMKIIKKTEMIMHRQEGHLRAERDFLVASEGCRWIVPLVSSFQDKENLYLITEYCVGGDFLGLLLTKNVLPEDITCFYLAEMVLAIEEAHTLRYIHRDIKPDNFIFTATGHIKLCDFGLAFSGLPHHSQADFQECSEKLMVALGLESGDYSSSTPLGNATNDSLRERSKSPRPRMAKSVVGTVQYMAPEILRGEFYDGRCDWWSLGIILFETLYGYTPFQVDDDQYETRHRILRHAQYLLFPDLPPISTHAKSLILSLLTARETRLSAAFYAPNDLPHAPNASFIHPSDAAPVKAHPFFCGIDFENLHKVSPPFVPRLESEEDTRYFEDDSGRVVVDESAESWVGRRPCGRAEELAVEFRKEGAFLGYTYRRPRSAVGGRGSVLAQF